MVEAADNADAWTNSQNFINRTLVDYSIAPAMTLVRGDLSLTVNIITGMCRGHKDFDILAKKAAIAMFIMQLPREQNKFAPCSLANYRKPWSDFAIFLLPWNASHLQERKKNNKSQLDTAVKDRWRTIRKVLHTYLSMIMRLIYPGWFPCLDEPARTEEAKECEKNWNVMYRGKAATLLTQVQLMLADFYPAEDSDREDMTHPEEDSEAEGTGAQADLAVSGAKPLLKQKEPDEPKTVPLDEVDAGHNKPTVSPETQNRSAADGSLMQAQDKAGTGRTEADTSKSLMPAQDKAGTGRPSDQADPLPTFTPNTGRVQEEEDQSTATRVFEIISAISSILLHTDRAFLCKTATADKAAFDAGLAETAKALYTSLAEEVAAVTMKLQEAVISTLSSKHNRFKYHRYMNQTGADSASRFVEEYVSAQCMIINHLPKEVREAPEVKSAVLHALGLWAYRGAIRAGSDGTYQLTAQERFKNILLRLLPWGQHPWPNVSLAQPDLAARISLTMAQGCRSVNIWEVFSQAVEPWRYGFFYTLQFANAYSADGTALIKGGMSIQHPVVSCGMLQYSCTDSEVHSGWLSACRLTPQEMPSFWTKNP